MLASHRLAHPALLALLLLLGCNSLTSSTDRGQVQPLIPESPPFGAPAAPSPSSAAPTAPAGPSGPLGSPDELLEGGVEKLSTDPRAAGAAFAQSQGVPLADAYAAYVALVAGDAADAGALLERTMEGLTEATREIAKFNGVKPTRGVKPTMKETLLILRLAAEDYEREGSGNRPPVACALFEKHGADALEAFRVLWGSSRDIHASSIKECCAKELLQKAAPAEALKVVSAIRSLFSAMQDCAPLPQQGTMFISMLIADAGIITDSVLAPEVPLTPTSPPIRLGDMLARAAKQNPAIRQRAKAYEAVQARAVPELEKGICAVLAARGHPAAPATCRARAEEASTRALAYWLADLEAATSQPP